MERAKTTFDFNHLDKNIDKNKWDEIKTSDKLYHKKNFGYTGEHISISNDWIYNDDRTEWSPVRSVIIRVINKSNDREAGVRSVNHEYDYRPNWTTRSTVTN